MNIRPIGERVVIQPMQKEDRTESGILLPDTAQEKPIEGKVVAVGPGRVNDKGEHIPLEVKVGDEVVFAKFIGTTVKQGGVDYLIVNGERDILCVIE
ncbi:MAG TPA: co-chaperone GroES [Candidatus Avidehalobacter gallistercoris]|uniref:Co-chaperonin GroES n=1 Tax=Candidatus Avidehalobacter gallistercoris TaxID=2840694 RepID=A0A9D1KYT1_9FIRM|nr:co-chaperone GroES [Candidatus Avidehalobacter gallistercoris]